MDLRKYLHFLLISWLYEFHFISSKPNLFRHILRSHKARGEATRNKNKKKRESMEMNWAVWWWVFLCHWIVRLSGRCCCRLATTELHILSLSLSVVLNCRRAIEVRENKLYIFVSRSLSAVISSSPTNFIPALSSFPSPPTITEPNFTSVLFRLRLYFIPCSIPSMADDAGGLISTSLEANLARGYAIETTRTRRH